MNGFSSWAFITPFQKDNRWQQPTKVTPNPKPLNHIPTRHSTAKMELPKSKQVDDDEEVSLDRFGYQLPVLKKVNDDSEVEFDTPLFVDEYSDEESFGQRPKNITDPTLVDDFVPSLSNSDYFPTNIYSVQEFILDRAKNDTKRLMKWLD